MNKTLRISFSLKNTYRVNGILFSLKQIPFLKKLLPATLYRAKGLKVFANVLSVLWEIVSAFLGKLLYFVTMVCGIGILYEKLPKSEVFLHVLLFLTVIGSFTNTHLFHSSREKYYAIILMRMDAREYTLVNYIYSMLKIVLGFLPFTIFFGMNKGVSFPFCLILPFCVAGLKCFVAALRLYVYEKKGVSYNEDKLSKCAWSFIAVLLAAAYGLPLLGVALPETVSMTIFLLFLPLGTAGLVKVLTFGDYREVNRELLAGLSNQMDPDAVRKMIKQRNEKNISADLSVGSNRSGFEYLNELFIKRHRKILWDSAKKISYVSAFLVIGVLTAAVLRPDLQPKLNGIVMTRLPYLVFLMNSLNRGEQFTQVLFMNCDHSLLGYSFYKRPKFILRLFQLRLREIIKINAVPAAVIGIGSALILFAAGGTDHPLNYLVLIVSVLSMSLFFSVHYLTIYYLFQPYNAGTEIKSGIYQILRWATSLLCLFFLNLRMPVRMFGGMTIVFCVLYSIVANVLVYRLAPKTFRVRM